MATEESAVEPKSERMDTQGPIGLEEEYRVRQYGIPKKQLPRHLKSQEVYVVPVEIELSWELYHAITDGLLHKYSSEGLQDFIQNRFLERMREVFSDNASFGEVKLEDFKDQYALQNAEDLCLSD